MIDPRIEYDYNTDRRWRESGMGRRTQPYDTSIDPAAEIATQIVFHMSLSDVPPSHIHHPTHSSTPSAWTSDPHNSTISH